MQSSSCIMNKGMILTTYRFREDDCVHEAWLLLSKFGFKDFEPLDVKMPGLILLKVNFDPIKAVEEIINYAKENVWSIKYILKAIPIEIITEAKEETIVKTAELLLNKIEENKSFRISIDKRESNIKSNFLIEQIAPKIKRKVDLVNYDYVILIEIIREIAGISVLKRDQIFCTQQNEKESNRRNAR